MNGLDRSGAFRDGLPGATLFTKLFAFRAGVSGFIFPSIFALLVLFLQTGISYYVSIQTIAMLLVIVAVLRAGAWPRDFYLPLSVFFLFSGLLLFTGAIQPSTVSQNSGNVLITSIGVIGYVGLFLASATLRPADPKWLLLVFKRSSALIITSIVLLVVVMESGIVAFLDREYFIFQNVDLITNYSAMDSLIADMAMRHARNIQPDIDLFYGEQSYLSLILFVCLVSNIVSSRALEFQTLPHSRPSRSGFYVPGISPLLLFGALGCMIYIRSFSSIVYIAIVGGFLVAAIFPRVGMLRLTPATLLAGVALVGVMGLIAAEAAPYYLHRIETFSTSLSAQQRFGVLLDFLPQDFLFGLHDPDRMPSLGFHNGLIYLVMMAGAGGIAFIAYLMNRVFWLGRPLGVAMLSALTLLAIFAQNGAILSPNKLVIWSFLILPLLSAERFVSGGQAFRS